MGGQRHAPTALSPPPLRHDPVPILWEAGWAPGLVWTGAENFAPPTPRFDPGTLNSTASRHTDCSIPASRTASDKKYAYSH